jgi:uncharacterized RDD family membrane protein YckC
VDVNDKAISVPAGLTTEGLLGRRYIARFIDSLVISLTFGVLVVLISIDYYPSLEESFWGGLLLIVFWIGYGTILESSRWQATLGKRWTGLRVYNSQAGRITPQQALGRNVVKDGPFLTFLFIPGRPFLSLAWVAIHLFVVHRSRVYQAIHDRAAHTWVGAPESTIQLRLS